jgi:hypothetical protein
MTFFGPIPFHELSFGRGFPLEGEKLYPRQDFDSESDTMISLIPEQMFASAFQLACYGVAMLTFVVSYLLVPRA